MYHLGLNVYCWTRDLQNAFLAEVVEPAVPRLRARWPGLRLWLNRHDCRGPHLMLLVTVPDRRAGQVLEANLAPEMERFFTAHPPTSPEGEARTLIEGRHEAAAGIRLCDPDREDGLAEEHSYVFFEQPAGSYPWSLSRGLADPDAPWPRVDELCRWVLGRIARRPETPQVDTALRLLAALDRHVAAANLDPEGLWRFYATSLLPRIAVRLRDDPEAFFAELPRIVRERNRLTFQAIWSAGERPAPPWPGLPDLVALLEAESGVEFARRHQLLRHVMHWTMKLLGVGLRLEIPIILFAWHRAWERRRSLPALVP